MPVKKNYKKKRLDKVLDTTVLFKSLLDSAKRCHSRTKRINERRQNEMQMNIKEKIFKLDLSFPYKDLNSLQALMSGKAGGSTGMSAALKNVFGKKEGDDAAHPKDPIWAILPPFTMLPLRKTLLRKKSKPGKI